MGEVEHQIAPFFAIHFPLCVVQPFLQVLQDVVGRSARPVRNRLLVRHLVHAFYGAERNERDDVLCVDGRTPAISSPPLDVEHERCSGALQLNEVGIVGGEIVESCHEIEHLLKLLTLTEFLRQLLQLIDTLYT